MFTRTLSVSLAVALFLGRVSLAAQTVPQRSMGQDVPVCTTAMEEGPCRVAFDAPPILLTPARTSAGAGKTPQVWLLVDESGGVRRAQIHISAGGDFDIAAVDSAKRLRFRPARRGDSAVASWIALPVPVGEIREACPGMGVPLSAGVASFVDSTVLERPELGTLYRFASEVEPGLADVRFDVFIYPASQWPTPTDQIANYLAVLDGQRARGDLAQFRVLENRERKFDVRTRRVHTQLRAHILRVSLNTTTHNESESAMAVFRHRDRFVKLRITYPPAGNYRAAAYEFVRQVLSALVSRPAHCQ